MKTFAVKVCNHYDHREFITIRIPVEKRSRIVTEEFGKEYILEHEAWKVISEAQEARIKRHFGNMWVKFFLA